MLKHFKYIILILLLVSFVACSVKKRSSVPRNLRMIYNPATPAFHPEIKMYNTSDTSSLIVEKIFTRELLYNLANEENKLLSKIKIYYALYDFEEKKELTDSLTTTFKFEKDSNIQYHLLKVPVSAEKGKEYILEIITTDQNRNNDHYSFLKVDRKGNISPQDYLVSNILSNELTTEHYINGSSSLKINHYKYDFDSLNVFYFPMLKEIPNFPDVNDTVQKYLNNYDTTWICYLDSIDYSNFSNKGIYYFTHQFNAENGFALLNFGKNFPVVRSPKELYEPLAYLQKADTIPVFDTTGKYTKLYVDNFWLDRANNMERSRVLIKLFYNRVFFANVYFTSYVEGWRTDRGMIYIIYGLPNYIYKSGEEERWIYHPDQMGPGITFYFEYQPSPFSLNHFVLNREKVKSSEWDKMIELWNSGEIYYKTSEAYR